MHTHCVVILFIQPGQDQEYGPRSHFMCEKWKEIKAVSFILAAVACGSLGQQGWDWQ